MEVKISQDGKKSYPASLKKKVLDLLEVGKSPAELAREFGVPIQSIHRWKHNNKKLREATYEGAEPQEVISKAEHFRQLAELEDQIKNLKRSLVNMTVDRDILKEAVSIASKKKWL